MCDRDDNIGHRRLGGVHSLHYGPICRNAEQNLRAEERLQQDAPAAKVANLAKTLADRAASPNDQKRNHDESDEVRQDSKGSVAKAGAEDELNENGSAGDGCKRTQAGRAAIVKRRKVTLPPGTGQQRETDHGNEEYLCECGV